MTETLYKFLTENGRGTYSGHPWSLPTAAGPGDWMPPVVGELVPCERGYHLCRAGDLLHWLGPVLYVAECRGERIDVADKIVVREARLVRCVTAWDERTARLFACDCAERVLPLFERAVPGDARPRTAIAVARRFAAGEVTSAGLTAARDAARAAVGAAAGGAVGAAAGGAARDAVGAAAWAGTKVAERQWQTARLLAYLDGTAETLTTA